VGFVPVLFEDRRRALQDYLAGTVVVTAPALSVAEQLRANRGADYLHSKQARPLRPEDQQ
jgi:hypothetical protein